MFTSLLSNISITSFKTSIYSMDFLHTVISSGYYLGTPWFQSSPPPLLSLLILFHRSLHVLFGPFLPQEFQVTSYTKIFPSKTKTKFHPIYSTFDSQRINEPFYLWQSLVLFSLKSSHYLYFRLFTPNFSLVLHSFTSLEYTRYISSSKRYYF